MREEDSQLIEELDLDIDQVELKGFARSIAEIEWLLLLIVLLYYMSPDAQIASPGGLLICMEVFGAFILGFHYVNFNLPHFKWKLALETWVMIAEELWRKLMSRFMKARRQVVTRLSVIPEENQMDRKRLFSSMNLVCEKVMFHRITPDACAK